jgi:adenine-specific DNA methylase
MQAQQADTRLIEAGFPCHQVGAETQRERGASNMLPAVYYLHVWWARRPLTPSRAAILASLLPADTDPNLFLRQLGIEKVQALVNGELWTLTEDKELKRIVMENGRENLVVDRFAEKWLEQEQERRKQNRELIEKFIAHDTSLFAHPVIEMWRKESKPLPEPLPQRGTRLPVQRVAADPAWFGSLMEIGKRVGIRVPNLYGYDRAYTHHPAPARHPLTILDPTAGGGSIPFEALRLGHKVIANELNSVATVILYATLDYPARFGPDLAKQIQLWGNKLVEGLDAEVKNYFPQGQSLPPEELRALKEHLADSGEPAEPWNCEEAMTYLYVRQVSCPHCGGEAPLLNSCWLSTAGEQWGVKVVTDGKAKGGKVRFETYRCADDKGPNGEDPDAAYVGGGEGRCIHCKQAIDQEEIKKQARGESDHGRWKDRLYCVVGVRRQPKLDAQGKPRRDREGQILVEKVTFFRPPNAMDLDALKRAEEKLNTKRETWEADEIIPTEKIPPGYETRIRWPLDRYGVDAWTDMFTSRQLLGHGTLVAQLRALTPQIIKEHGSARGRAVVTYLQFAIDKGLDYNSKQSGWHAGRNVIEHAFVKHGFPIKWVFGEMVFSGPQSGFSWCLSQMQSAYSGIAELTAPVQRQLEGDAPFVSVLNGSGAHMPSVAQGSIDLICMDPPYYNNVTYSELSDFFYIWQRRTLRGLYPDLFERRFTDKANEAVANPFRDGSKEAARDRYQQMMGEIFAECRRVVKDDGRMLIMFTHKSQDAWTALTQAIIQSGWTITPSRWSPKAERVSTRKNVRRPSVPCFWRVARGSWNLPVRRSGAALAAPAYSSGSARPCRRQ